MTRNILSILSQVTATLKHPGWQSTIGGFSMHLVLGTLYLWGIITVPLTSYLRKYDSTITYDDTILIYGTQLAAQGATYILGGFLAKRLGYRTTCFIGGYILVIGCFLSSLVRTFPTLLITYGLLFGIGLGFNYTPPIACAASWIPHRKGLITGIIVAGFGGGAFIFQFVTSAMLFNGTSKSDPRNTPINGYFPTDSPVLDNVPKTFVVLACCYFVLITVGCLLLSEPQISKDSQACRIIGAQSTHDKPYQATTEYNALSSSVLEESSCTSVIDSIELRPTKTSSNQKVYESLDSKDDVNSEDDMVSSHGKTNGSSTISDLSVPNVTPIEMLLSPLGWHLASCLVTTTIGGMYLLGTYKVYGEVALGASADKFLSLVGGVSALFNASGRIFWGALGDRIGPIEALMVMTLGFSFILFTYSLSPDIGGGNGFMIWTFAIFGFEGGNFALYMPVTIQLFGPINSSTNYAILSTVYAAFNVSNIALLSSQRVNFEFACRAMGLLTFTGFANLCALRWHVSHRTKAQSVRCD